MSETSCQICYRPITTDHEVRYCNNCGYDFHRTCILTAIQRNNTCPICRREFFESADQQNIGPSMPLTHSTRFQTDVSRAGGQRGTSLWAILSAVAPLGVILVFMLATVFLVSFLQLGKVISIITSFVPIVGGAAVLIIPLYMRYGNR